jgi:hypothetical protein
MLRAFQVRTAVTRWDPPIADLAPDELVPSSLTNMSQLTLQLAHADLLEQSSA